MYMCLDAVKKGFLAGCRPIIGLLLGDPNDNYFSIAVATVEAKTKDSWGWFLEMLLNDIGESENISKVIANTGHRLYLRHLYANCKKAYGGGTILRDLILSIAKATYVEE
ncbi:hypothetical protein Ahy_A06g029424 isoform B [Arachis hypogaea]|uniref:MULE transposase domain-containing protein n=1 Tax=Arachis hypogaea TaxID=3818 RepID=A0A445CTB3_ARAHY|nr:hypothetical protein Ahy_A06g029424 isoform B [Arachis hypogaea]